MWSPQACTSWSREGNGRPTPAPASSTAGGGGAPASGARGWLDGASAAAGVPTGAGPRPPSGERAAPAVDRRCRRPPPDRGAAGRTQPALGRQGARPGSDASRRSMRANSASGESSASGWASRTRATSRVTRGSGASRMATWASPSTSMARTSAASPTRSACEERGVLLGVRDRHQVGGHQGQESLAEMVDQVPGQLLRAVPGRRQVGHRHQGTARRPARPGPRPPRPARADRRRPSRRRPPGRARTVRRGPNPAPGARPGPAPRRARRGGPGGGRR